MIVPILTQSEDWALFKESGKTAQQVQVPILTQSEDWALWSSGDPWRRDKEFQSSPSPKTGRYAVFAALCAELATLVPILTQSEDWAL